MTNPPRPARAVHDTRSDDAIEAWLEAISHTGIVRTTFMDGALKHQPIDPHDLYVDNSPPLA